MKTAFVQFNYFCLEIPIDALADCYHQGRCDEDVDYWVKRVTIDVEPSTLATELKEYGAWDDCELSDHEQNKCRILWLAAGNYHDEKEA